MTIQNNPRKSQNLIEVILIIPLLIIILVGIMEYAMFQRTVNVVQDIALDAAVAASKDFVSDNITPTDPFNENLAVRAALNIVFKRAKALGFTSEMKYYDLGSAYGKRPFALYEFHSTKTVQYKGQTVPQLKFTVDYRDPVTKGVSTQLIYQYKLMLYGFKLKVPGGRTIQVIPSDIQISSTQTRQYIHY